MNKTKILLVSLLLLFSTTTFAKGFSSPEEGLLFFKKVGEKAMIYKNKYKKFSDEHKKELLPYLYKPSLDRAGTVLSHYRGAVLGTITHSSIKKEKMVRTFKYFGPFLGHDWKAYGYVKMYYCVFESQCKRKSAYNGLKFKPKKDGKKIIWFIY